MKHAPDASTLKGVAGPRGRGGVAFARMNSVTIPVDITSALDPSPALNRHAELQLARALRPYITHVDRVRVRIDDVNGPRRGRDDKVVRIEVLLRPSGHVLVSAESGDSYLSVTRAAARAGLAVARHVRRLQRQAAAARRRSPDMRAHV